MTSSPAQRVRFLSDTPVEVIEVGWVGGTKSWTVKGRGTSRLMYIAYVSVQCVVYYPWIVYKQLTYTYLLISVRDESFKSVRLSPLRSYLLHHDFVSTLDLWYGLVSPLINEDKPTQFLLTQTQNFLLIFKKSTLGPSLLWYTFSCLRSYTFSYFILYVFILYQPLDLDKLYRPLHSYHEPYSPPSADFSSS